MASDFRHASIVPLGRLCAGPDSMADQRNLRIGYCRGLGDRIHGI